MRLAVISWSWDGRRQKANEVEATELTMHSTRPPQVLTNPFWLWKLSSSVQTSLEAPVFLQRDEELGASRLLLSQVTSKSC